MVPLSGAATAWTREGWFFYGGLNGGLDNPDCTGEAYGCGTGALYDPSSDSWEMLEPPPFEEEYLGQLERLGRLRASATWDGEDRVVVWGGEQSTGQAAPSWRAYADGAIYHLSTRRWEYLPAPEGMVGRGRNHQTLWIGDGVFIWGGHGDDDEQLPRGGGVLRLDALSWEPTPREGAHAAAHRPTMVWTGNEVLMWGGLGDEDEYIGTGASYDPESREWQPLSQDGAPRARSAHTAVWTGHEMLVFGGARGEVGVEVNLLGDGAAYDPANDTWRPLSKRGAPSPRGGHIAVWTGTHMLVWGGERGCPAGALYDPEADEWTPMTTEGAPPGTWNPYRAWTGEQLLVRGGIIGDVYYFSQIGVFTP